MAGATLARGSQEEGSDLQVLPWDHQRARPVVCRAPAGPKERQGHPSTWFHPSPKEGLDRIWLST